MKQKQRYWTEAEFEFMRENYPNMETEDIALKLGRTRQAIWIKAQKLGLRKYRKWTTGEVKKAWDMWLNDPEITYQEIADQMGFETAASNVGWHIRNAIRKELKNVSTA